ncbi:S-layer homology domain-containing protein [Paenisporosarcina cavernae]|uniref:S-layer homology domain-containing protein n=1 Tax=Paenisporosarcina cavernae TaxID=2320858 RepID=UPI0013C406DD|nr:S-layer homology domain-containing protein [Paenisporosarcina cavernae]
MKKLLLSILFLILLVPTQALAAGFSDVPTNHWAYASIDKLTKQNILNGYTNGTFLPSKPVTRAEAALIIARATVNNKPTSFQAKFTDVPKNHPAYNAIQSLTELGVFSNSVKFNPDKILWRSEMSKIIVEAYDIIVDDNNEVFFPDMSPRTWYFPYATTIAEVKISEGLTPLKFGPGYATTRAQLATFIDRAMTFKQKRDAGIITYDKTKKQYLDSTISTTDDFALETIHLVNIERAKEGLNPLKEDGSLSKIAFIKAKDMVENDYFDHVSPTYGQPWDMAKHFNYSYSYFGENIALGQRTPAEVVNDWMNSSGHRANILNPNYTQIGASAYKNSQGRIYWVHMFAKK